MEICFATSIAVKAHDVYNFGATTQTTNSSVHILPYLCHVFMTHPTNRAFVRTPPSTHFHMTMLMNEMPTLQPLTHLCTGIQILQTHSTTSI